MEKECKKRWMLKLILIVKKTINITQMEHWNIFLPFAYLLRFLTLMHFQVFFFSLVWLMASSTKYSAELNEFLKIYWLRDVDEVCWEKRMLWSECGFCWWNSQSLLRCLKVLRPCQNFQELWLNVFLSKIFVSLR